MVQYNLFDTLSSSLIEVPPQTELPKILSQHTRGVQLGSHFVPYELRRSKRRSIGFLITEQGLRISAPRWVTLAEINDAIVKQQRWILTKLEEQQRLTAQQQINTIVTWTSGSQLPFLGHTATLQLCSDQANRYDDATKLISLNLPPNASSDQCKKYLHAWLKQQAHQLFGERLAHFAQLLNVQYHSFALSNATTQWGSCNVHKKIRLNWRLIHLPMHLIHYVIVHELAHLIEMNHSPRFWAIVAKLVPNYLAVRTELRQLVLTSFPQF